MPVCSSCRREFPYANGLDLSDALLCSSACLKRWRGQQGRAERIMLKFDKDHRMAALVTMGKDWSRKR